MELETVVRSLKDLRTELLHDRNRIDAELEKIGEALLVLEPRPKLAPKAARQQTDEKVLEALANSHDPLTATDLTNRTGISNATIYKSLARLVTAKRAGRSVHNGVNHFRYTAQEMILVVGEGERVD